MAVKIPKIPNRNSLLNTSLEGMDDIFSFAKKEEDTADVRPSSGDIFSEISFDSMEPFPNHRFKLYTGQRLQDMIDSIREYGILVPVILWKHDGRYTILSGHNRENAGKLAGLSKSPAIIKESLSYEDAVLIVTETNLRQRSFEDLSPSERAYCLKQHYDAIKSQGKRNDLLNEIHMLVNPHEIKGNPTSLGNPKKLGSNEKVSEEYGLSKDRIARYLRIATLAPPLLDCLDTGTLGFEAAYAVSFVKEDGQRLIADMMVQEGHAIDTKKAGLLHDYAKNDTLTDELVRKIVSGEKTRKPKNSAVKPIQIKGAVISRYFTEDQSRKEVEKIIEMALEQYFTGMNAKNEQMEV